MTDARNAEIVVQLGTWERKQSQGKVTSSSDGFVPPKGARRSPDAAWTSKIRLKTLSQQSFRVLASEFGFRDRTQIRYRPPAGSAQKNERVDRERSRAWVVYKSRDANGGNFSFGKEI